MGSRPAKGTHGSLPGQRSTRWDLLPKIKIEMDLYRMRFTPQGGASHLARGKDPERSGMGKIFVSNIEEANPHSQ